MNHIKTFLIVVLIVCTMTTLLADSNQQVIDALELTKGLHVEEIFVGDALRAISNASIYEARYGFVLSNQNEDIFLARYFLEDMDGLTFFDTAYQVVCSEEFINSIRPEFSLTSIDDGLLFQQFLYAVDDNFFNEGFYIEGNTWVFVRDEFFGDIEAFIVETDGNGTITSISHEYDAELTMGDELYENLDMDFIYNETEYIPIPSTVFDKILPIMQQELDYTLDVSVITSSHLAKVSKANWYSCEISIDEEYDDMYSSSLYEVFPFEKDGEILLFDEIRDLLTSSAFIDSIRTDFFLIDEASAELFELALDDVSDFDRREKARFERNGSWVFIREEFFDEGMGYIVSTDEGGAITKVTYSMEIPLEGVDVPEEPIGVPFDESEVTWTFTLLDPLKKLIWIPYPEDIPVCIEFNDWAANQIGAWIGTFQDDALVNVYSGTDITSPFYDLIPGEYLYPGENRISYRLLRPGNDYDKAIASIDLSIWIGELPPLDLTTLVKTIGLTNLQKELPL